MNGNDLLDNVELLECDHATEGAELGHIEGQKRQYKDGFVKGSSQACHVIHEIGSLYSILISISCSCKNDLNPENVEINHASKKNLESHAFLKHPIVLKSTSKCPEHEILSPRLQLSRKKLLEDLKNEKKWLELGVTSEEKLVEHLCSIQSKAKFILQKLNIPTHFEDKALDADF